MVFHALEAPWVLPAALAVSGLVFLGDAASQTGPRQHTLETFALNVVSLPVGVLTLVVGLLDALHGPGLDLATGAGIAIGAILAGRSLREVPWTGVVSLAIAAAAAWFLDTHSPWALSLTELVVVTAVVFLIVYGILYLIELPMRLAGLVALPRPFLVVLGVASLGLAGYVALLGLG